MHVMILNCLEAGAASIGSFVYQSIVCNLYIALFSKFGALFFLSARFWWVESMGYSLDCGIDYCFGHVVTYLSLIHI